MGLDDLETSIPSVVVKISMYYARFSYILKSLKCLAQGFLLATVRNGFIEIRGTLMPTQIQRLQLTHHAGSYTLSARIFVSGAQGQLVGTAE